MTGRRRRAAGFTLVELIIALTLMALPFRGAVRFARPREPQLRTRGEAKAESTSEMRLAAQFLRSQVESQHPQRMRKVQEFPLLFTGDRDAMTYAASLPERVQGGGVLAVSPRGAPARRQARSWCSSG